MATASRSLTSSYQRRDNFRKERTYVPYRRPARAKQDLEDAWWTGSPAEEAKSFFAFMVRTGSTPALIEEMILVNDAEFLELNEWVNQRPVVLPLVERMMEFREETLKYFRALVEEMPPVEGNITSEPEIEIKPDPLLRTAIVRRKMPRGLSGFRGVSRVPGSRKWQAKMRVAGKYQLFGSFDSPEEAARCYDENARLLLGDEAVLNFPKEELCKQGH